MTQNTGIAEVHAHVNLKYIQDRAMAQWLSARHKIKGSLFRASSEVLPCVLNQDTLSSV